MCQARLGHHPTLPAAPSCREATERLCASQVGGETRKLWVPEAKGELERADAFAGWHSPHGGTTPPTCLFPRCVDACPAGTGFMQAGTWSCLFPGTQPGAHLG